MNKTRFSIAAPVHTKPFFTQCMMLCALVAFFAKLSTAAPPEDKALPTVQFWYGDRQVFGEAGHPQPLVNILGSVQSLENVADATYRVNGRRVRQMRFGPDLHRLARRGNFNLEINRSELRPGENTVEIRLRTPNGRDVSRSVAVVFNKENTCQLPLEIDFTKVKQLQSVVEIIDGEWRLTPDGVRTAEPYYDRQLAFGNPDWKDVELRAEIIFHSHFPSIDGRQVQGSPYLSHAHTSFNLRWGGHPDDGFQPRRDWQNLGALVAMRADLNTRKQGSYWWMHFGRGIPGKPSKRGLVQPQRRFQISPGDRMHYRLRVETVTPQSARYSAKIWRKGEAEPDVWQVQAIDQSEANPSGSVVFVVHHSDVTLCHVRVEKISDAHSQDK